MYEKKLSSFLTKVEKPARYIGGELNSIIKNKKEIDIRFAFCFPDVYEIGMSHLGMKILYHLLNEQKDIWCERVFTPWPDMEEKMQENDILLYGLESKEPINGFDFVGFTLLYEMSYSNVLNMLSLAKIPLFSKERTEDDPFVCAGGPCSVNPEPLAEFIDFYMIGEGEEIMLEVMEAYRKHKKSGEKRIDFLKTVAKISGIYVPSFYDVTYNEDETISSVMKNETCAADKIERRVIKDFDNTYFPDKIIVPFIDIVHDRITLEVQRGCIRGCRFCQAGMIYRPVREKSPNTLLKTAKTLFECSGYDEISLCSLSTSDYSQLKELCEGLKDYADQNRINLALPSLRLDSFSFDLMKSIGNQRKSSLTFAPEAATQRLRDVINKNITEENLITSSKMAFEEGYGSLKLYFMIGLPTEEMSDVYAIKDLGNKVVDLYFETPKKIRNKKINVTISTSSFVPKPFTPFQWCAQDTMEVLEEKQRMLKSEIRRKQISYNWHDAKTSYLEAVFARGDRRLSKVLYSAYQKGCKFDSWNEFFKYDNYIEAFEKNNLSPAFYANRERSTSEILPWDIIDIGVTKEFLIREFEKSKKAETSQNCVQQCNMCGIKKYEAGVCFE